MTRLVASGLRSSITAVAIFVIGLSFASAAGIEQQREIFKRVYADVERGNWDVVDALSMADQRLLAPEELRARFAEAGAHPDEPTYACCGSGVTACHLVLAASVAGLPEPRLYPGSYSQWVREGMPVDTGD